MEKEFCSNDHSICVLNVQEHASLLEKQAAPLDNGFPWESFNGPEVCVIESKANIGEVCAPEEFRKYLLMTFFVSGTPRAN